MYGPELNQGTTIADRYLLKEYKGSGSFGEVWLAEDIELGIDIAIKLYISLDQKGQDEFKDEYKVAYGLSHENLLTAQYYSVWDHRPYLIMKYCSRGSAGNIGGTLSEIEVWKFIHDVANGLKYLHGQEPPIVHQDIKPENILIDEQGNYLITDFGISKKMRTTMRKQSKRSIESGAIAYMGPERFLKDPMAVKASDIWSLGVSIFELATNDLPFMGQGGGMLNAGAALPELDEKWSRNLNEIMQACLAKDTWDRPTAEDLAEYTQQVLKGKDISWAQWKKGETQETLPVESTTSKKGIIITIISALILILFLGIYFWNNSKENNRQIIIEQRFANLKSMCENNLNVGNAQNYTSLLAAKSLLDSLKIYRKDYKFISGKPENSINTIESTLETKITDAQNAWIRAAEGQLNIAEDVSTAIMYYHIAYLLDNNTSIENTLSRIESKYGCLGALMVITDAKLNGDNLTLHYIGLNKTQINDMHLRYELYNSNGTNPIMGQVSIPFIPGLNQSVTIALNGSVSDQRHLILLNNNTIFYNSNTEE